MNTPTFYAMVVNKALELGVLSKGMTTVLKYALTRLQRFVFEGGPQRNRDRILRAHQSGPVAVGAGRGPSGNQEESTGSNDVLPVSDNEDGR